MSLKIASFVITAASALALSISAGASEKQLGIDSSYTSVGVSTGQGTAIQGIVGTGKTQGIVGTGKTQGIVGTGKTQGIVGTGKTQGIVGTGKTQGIVGTGKTQGIVGTGRS